MFELDATITHRDTKNKQKTRTDEYVQWRLDVCNALIEAGYGDVAESFESCASHPKTKVSPHNPDLPDGIATIWVCSDNQDHNNVIFSETCDCRICPDCARRQVARLAKRYIPHALHLQKHGSRRYSLRHIVLTTPFELIDDDIEQKFKDTFNAVTVAFNELLPVGWRKEQGLLVAAEFGEDGHKLHFHIVHYGQFLEKTKITTAWENATGGECSINWVKSMVGQTDEETENAVIEILKYSVKFWKIDDDGTPHFIDPELMPILHRVLKGTRRIRSYGVFYGLGEPETDGFCCEQCGSEMVRIGKEHWVVYRQTGFTPLEWKKALRGSLDLKLANKSEFESGKADNRLLPETQ